jgi:opacity protein-like surface antigen
MNMKWITQTLITSCLVVATTAHAVNPASGGYAGLIVGANYAANFPFTYLNTSGELENGQLGHNIMASIGGQVGLRWCDNYRAEAEFIFNNSPYSYLRLGDVSIHAPQTSTGLRMNGKTDSGIATINIFYDIFADFSSNVVPYFGIGAGYAYIKSDIKLYLNEVRVTADNNPNIVGTIPTSKTASAPVGQAILGLSYYMDDYSYFALDLRYLMSADQTLFTQQVQQTSNTITARYQLYSFNLIFNGAFDAVA